MKKLGIILCILALVGCGKGKTPEELYKEYQKALGKKKNIATGDIPWEVAVTPGGGSERRVDKFSFEGHKYILFKTNKGWNNAMCGVVHDPECEKKDREVKK